MQRRVLQAQLQRGQSLSQSRVSLVPHAIISIPHQLLRLPRPSWQHTSKPRRPPDSAPMSLQQADSPVSIQLRAVLVAVFQKRMQRSAVPPPEASRPCWWGDHAMACNTARLAALKYAQQAVEFKAAQRQSTACCRHAAAAGAKQQQASTLQRMRVMQQAASMHPDCPQ